MTKFNGGWNPRHGSEEDVSLLEALFRELDFEVHVEENLPSLQLTDKLKSVTRKDHSSYDCFVMFIMSHGLSGKVVCSDGEKIKINDLRDMISECETLSGKPKLLFIDACRGELEEDEAPKHADFSVVYSTVDGCRSFKADGKMITIDELRDLIRECETLSGKPKLLFIDTCRGELEEDEAPKHPDFSVVYSTVDGYRSFKAINGGSLFVRSFVKVFREWKAFEDLDGILKRVIREVSGIEINNIEEEDQSKTSKQVPEVNYTLSRDLYF